MPRLAVIATVCVVLAAGVAPAGAAEVTLEAMPARYIHVDGDEEKFRAQHWMNDGFAGGIRDASLSRVFRNGVELRSEGHAIVGQNDFGAALSLEKQGEGFLRFDFSEFRKWYDGTGGTYYPNTSLQTVDTDRDLALDIGSFSFVAGLAPPAGYPQLSFEYEREYKDGAKSRLTWGTVAESGVARNTAPSWQEVEERTDAFTLNLGQEVGGFSLAAKQRWEFVRAEYLRHEQNFSTAATASQRKIREQEQDPQADLMTTTLTAQRNFLEERGFFSSGYHFAHMDNREFESIVESSAAGTPTNFSNPKQIRSARADNDYDAHTWVGSVLFKLCKALTLTSRLKAETIRRESFSLYPADAAPNSAGGSTPNGVIDQQVVSQNENRADRWGEALLLRFTGVPRTALYAEAELEQGRVRVSEDRRDLLGPNAGETFNRFTIADVNRETFTLGGQASPCSFFNATAHARHRSNHNDYDDQRESDPTGSTARSAFFDGQRVETDELAARLAFRPAGWIQPAVRYQLRDDDFATRVENEPSVETEMLSHVVTADLSLQILRDLLATFSYSRQSSEVRAPARLSAAANTPPFHSDVGTWLASADWTLCPTVALTGTFLYSRAENFDDFTQSGLPMGADDERVDVTAGLNWTPKEDVSFGVEYAFYHYAANPNVGSGDYDAHLVSVEGSKKF